MKKNLIYSVSFALLLLIAAGCSENQVTNPDANNVKKRVNWLSLPVKEKLSLEKVFVISELINGEHGGKIKMNEQYDAINNQTIKIKSNLTVPGNNQSFSGNLLITQVVGSEAAIDFYPDISFDAPLIFDLKFTGLDLADVNPDHLMFCYIDPNGAIVPAEYDSKNIDIQKKILEIKGVKLKHFSRYGWVKTD
jgi:hypothetical protein